MATRCSWTAVWRYFAPTLIFVLGLSSGGLRRRAAIHRRFSRLSEAVTHGFPHLTGLRKAKQSRCRSALRPRLIASRTGAGFSPPRAPSPMKQTPAFTRDGAPAGAFAMGDGIEHLRCAADGIGASLPCSSPWHQRSFSLCPSASPWRSVFHSSSAPTSHSAIEATCKIADFRRCEDRSAQAQAS